MVLYMVVDPMSMRARGCGPFEGPLHTPSAGTQKNYIHDTTVTTCIFLQCT